MTTEMKTYVCTARYYSKGKLYEKGEKIVVPVGTPMSRAWRDPSAAVEEDVPQGPENLFVPQGPKLEFVDKPAEAAVEKPKAPKATPPSPRRVSDKSL